MPDESPKRPRPEWLAAMPPQLGELLEQIYEALDQNQLRLIPAGLRTLIELTGRQQVREEGSLPWVLLQLERRDLIGVRDRDRLCEVVRAINAAVHEGQALSREAVLYMVMCVERLLQSAFVLLPHPELREMEARRKRT